MSNRFVCASCNKKKNIKFKALSFRLFNNVQKSNICVTCWSGVFNCNKSNLLVVDLELTNIIVTKKDVCSSGLSALKTSTAKDLNSLIVRV